MPGRFQNRVIRVQPVLRNTLLLQYWCGSAIFSLWNTEWHQYRFTMGKPHQNFAPCPSMFPTTFRTCKTECPVLEPVMGPCSFTVRESAFQYGTSIISALSVPSNPCNIMVPWQNQAIVQMSSQCSRIGPISYSLSLHWAISVTLWFHDSIRYMFNRSVSAPV